MKQILSIVIVSMSMIACAGNPPAWWNPGNRYGQIEQSTITADMPIEPETPVIKEEKLEPILDNTYEEEVLELPLEEDISQPSPSNSLPTPSVLE